MTRPRERLRHVYWIGGGSGAGKTTVGRRLAGRHGLRLYATDEAMADHARRCSPEECPMLAAFQKMSMDERWLDRAPQTMLATFHWFGGEGFRFIIDDLLALPADRGILVEGFRLLPRLVAPVLARPANAVWLLPTPAFRAAAFETRGTLWTIAGRTRDPDRALRNLLERDRLFTVRLEEEVGRLGLAAVQVALPLGETDLEERVASRFGF